MTSESGNRLRRLKGCLALCAIAAIGCLLIGDANAVDGNYASPYASQWDTRSGPASLPDETLLGILLVTLTAVAATFYFLRDRLRRRRQAA